MTTNTEKVTPDEFLRSLGDTADEVAASLKRAGIRGCRLAAGDCPIERALALTGIVDDPKVGRNDWYSRVSYGRYSEAHPLPAACKDFVSRFDNCEWPELEASHDDES
jgi:hypothetical protein